MALPSRPTVNLSTLSKSPVGLFRSWTKYSEFMEGGGGGGGLQVGAARSFVWQLSQLIRDRIWVWMVYWEGHGPITMSMEVVNTFKQLISNVMIHRYNMYVSRYGSIACIIYIYIISNAFSKNVASWSCRALFSEASSICLKSEGQLN